MESSKVKEKISSQILVERYRSFRNLAYGNGLWRRGSSQIVGGRFATGCSRGDERRPNVQAPSSANVASWPTGALRGRSKALRFPDTVRRNVGPQGAAARAAAACDSSAMAAAALARNPADRGSLATALHDSSARPGCYKHCLMQCEC